jgi:hypothetical protein
MDFERMNKTETSSNSVPTVWLGRAAGQVHVGATMDWKEFPDLFLEDDKYLNCFVHNKTGSF